MKYKIVVLLTLVALTMGFATEVDAPSVDAAQKKELNSNFFLDVGCGFIGISYHDNNDLDEMFTHDYHYDADGSGIVLDSKIGRIWKDAMAFYGDISFAIAHGTFQGTEGCLFCRTEEFDENVEISRLTLGFGFRGFIRNPTSIMDNAYLGASLFMVQYGFKGDGSWRKTRADLGLDIGKQWTLGEHWLIGPSISTNAGLFIDFTFSALLTISRR
ncbi:MAG: hypothetical protein MJZ91_10295 [Bacteroidales bacterium]|nr:hypothetical protein [Bacteroidales bacterium]